MNTAWVLAACDGGGGLGEYREETLVCIWSETLW